MSTLTVVPTLDEGGGEAFLADVCAMLERIAERAGVRLVAGASTDQCRVYELPGAPVLPGPLVWELGVHRAQLVPAGSLTGRIVTVKVVVRNAARSGPSARGDVLKTYNYPLGRVAVHDSGEVVPLADVLAGLA